MLCGHDIRKQKFSVSTETKHLIISILWFEKVNVVLGND